ncbi:putative FAD-dependent pyridine nucleotide-disulphide oxidoreductase [Crocosphaera subtropica ATCC 51142]|uniref:FAD-dependent pyridine nucleotide-disulphide oxidoreductase n=1 Tax=Crocosphaera subtropica (strain ATCC 51142 / BH68) TaxID=43989 RepID=B1WQU8_CROS5|nr:NAD(P)/FAD-dependent oxidoreductase [Crocosphaera subtropica]ACB53400.1 putative FAD-dependent pyridine nucleotide-disulphide oxidoreductase [Crocosphaera subtropica ATCC 51142]
MNTNNSINICVLGGGFSGLYTALYLSNYPQVKLGQWKITLVERNDNFLFTPLLYELITGELQRWEIAPTYQKLLAGTSIKFCQHIVKKIDLENRQVKLDNDNSLSYDYLVLGLGTQNRWVDIPGLKTHALTFRTLRDLEQLQAKIHYLETLDRKHLRVAIIGGGPNGVELSCKLADRLEKRAEVLLIDRGNQILKGLSNGIRKASYRALGSRGVQLYLNTNVEEIEKTSITINHGEHSINVPVDMVIWVAGTESKPLIQSLNCQQTSSGRLLTNSRLQLIDYPEVFALGDLAQISNKKKSLPTTAQVAYQQASCAAKNIAAIIERKPLKSFNYLHLGDMLTLGRRTAIISSYGININGQIGGMLRRLAYIFRLPTMRHRLQVLRNFVQKIGLKISRFFQEIITNLLGQKSSRKYSK